MAWADFQDRFISLELGKPGTLTKQTHSRKPMAKQESQDISGGNESGGGTRRSESISSGLERERKCHNEKPILAKIF